MSRLVPIFGAVLVGTSLFSACERQAMPFSAAADPPAPSQFRVPDPKAPDGRTAFGITAIDPRWARYRPYLQQLVTAVQTEWDNGNRANGVSPQPGSAISVTFALDATGRVTNIVDVAPSESISARNMRVCLAAITNRASYGSWTDDMISSLGQKQRMTMGFFYDGADGRLLVLTRSEAALESTCCGFSISGEVPSH